MSSSTGEGLIVKLLLLVRVKSSDASKDVFASKPNGVKVNVLLDEALEGVPLLSGGLPDGRFRSFSRESFLCDGGCDAILTVEAREDASLSLSSENASDGRDD